MKLACCSGKRRERLTRRRLKEGQAQQRPFSWGPAVKYEQSGFILYVYTTRRGREGMVAYLGGSEAGVLEAALEESDLVGVGHWSHDC